MPTIHPTNKCFDDALDFIAEIVKQDPESAFKHLRLVHAICLMPNEPNKGQPYAHAWVEIDRDECIQGGILDGVHVYYATKRHELYKMLRVQMTTVYTVEEAWEKNRESNTFGPWESAYRELCREKINA